MKVLLTGGSGFVGSHILDGLRRRDIDTVLLLRPTSDRSFIEPHLKDVEVRVGSMDDAASLVEAARDVTHVIHCAGAIKALTTAGFYSVNETGTRQVVAAVNAHRDRVQRLVHLSSLAAAGPTVPGRSLVEEDEPRPVSEYGRSKLAGERVVRAECRSGHVILRPPAVYGPRDREFLRLFKAARAHLRPRFGGGRQALNLVYVEDLARAAIECLVHPAVVGHTYFVAADETVSARGLTEAVAASMKTWTIPLPLPTGLLWLAGAVQEVVSRRTGRPNVLSRRKYVELRAPAWLCDAGRLRRDAGIACPTSVSEGLARTLAWYRERHWI